MLLWEWQLKLMHTVLFSKYLEWGNSNDLSPEHYYGTGPAHFLALLDIPSGMPIQVQMTDDRS